MWIVILIIVASIIGKFLYDRNQQASKINKEGGMRNKYRELIEFLMRGHSSSRFLHEDSDSITLGVSNSGGTTLFILTQTFGQVTIQWKVDSPVFGKHMLEWDFPEYGSQEMMAETMSNDIGRYQQNL